jgi:hypothetical protein
MCSSLVSFRYPTAFADRINHVVVGDGVDSLMFRMETKKENAHKVSSSRRPLESHPSFSNASERPAAKRRKTHTPNDSTEIDFDSVKNVSEIQV